jgi:hypothetical protein
MSNLNDAYLDVLRDYSGSVDDKRKAYLMKYLNYTKDTSLNDLEWDVLKKLGFNNSLTDAWLSHLKGLGGLTLSDKGRLLGSTFYGVSPLRLFSNNEQGVWYDPSDLTTLFQDTAGTTPVTATGQTVGLMLDKSKGAVLGSELVTNGDFATDTWWSKNVGVTIGAGVCTFTGAANNTGLYKDGVTTTAYYEVTYTIVSILSGALRPGVGTARGATRTTAGTYTDRLYSTSASGVLSMEAVGSTTAVIDNVSLKVISGNHATQATTASKPTYGVVPLGGRRNILLATDTMATQSVTVTAAAHTLSFTGTGTVTLTGASVAGPLVGTGAGNRVSLTFTPTAGSLTLTVAGSVTFAQLETGSTATAYQRVGSTAFDVTEAGVQSLSYLSFDGVDDGMVTNTITPAIDKAQVFTGVRKLSDAGSIIVEHSSNAQGNSAFYLVAGEDLDSRYSFNAAGTLFSANTAARWTPSASSPDTAVISSTGDIAGDLNTIRRNGVAGTNSTANQGTGNYLAYPLYIGRRGGTTLPFNGHIYSLIVRFGANLTTDTITSTETYVNGKTGAY